MAVYETEDSLWCPPRYFLLTGIILLPLWVKKIKDNYLIHTHKSVPSKYWRGHGAHACTHTSQHKLCRALFLPSPAGTQSPGSPFLRAFAPAWPLSSSAAPPGTLAGWRCKTHSLHTGCTGAASIKLFLHVPVLRLFIYGTLLSGCILVCDHCLPDNWQIAWLQLTWCEDDAW